MQDVLNVREMSTVALLNHLILANKANDQSTVNHIAYELAYRTYIPNTGISFDDLLKQYGYQAIERPKEEKSKQKVKTWNFIKNNI